MNLPPLPLIEGCLFIDNSGWVEKMSTCNRALQYSQLEKKISAGETPALNFGSAIHLALEYRYKKYGIAAVDNHYWQDLAVILSAEFEKHPTPLGDYRTLNHAMEVMKRYLIKYDTEDFSLMTYNSPQICSHCQGKGNIPDVICLWCNSTGLNTAMVELPFALPLFTWKGTEGETNDEIEIPVFYSGRIDLPINKAGGIFVNDHKTTSVLGPSFWDDKKMSAQQKGYCWAFEQLTGMKVQGYMVDAIRVKEVPQYVQKGLESKSKGPKSPEAWWDESLQREHYYLVDGELEEWKNNTINLVEEFFWHYQRGFFPQKTSWCSSKFGKCPYFDVCTTHPAKDRDLILNAGNYTNNVWSPLIQPTQAKGLA